MGGLGRSVRFAHISLGGPWQQAVGGRLREGGDVSPTPRSTGHAALNLWNGISHADHRMTQERAALEDACRRPALCRRKTGQKGKLSAPHGPEKKDDFFSFHPPFYFPVKIIKSFDFHYTSDRLSLEKPQQALPLTLLQPQWPLAVFCTPHICCSPYLKPSSPKRSHSPLSFQSLLKHLFLKKAFPTHSCTCNLALPFSCPV